MNNNSSAPGPFAYGLVFLILGAYFGWLLDRMAAFSHHGFLRLDHLLIGVGVGLAALALAGLASALAKRHRRTATASASAESGRA